jgi:hypothetical protein
MLDVWRGRQIVSLVSHGDTDCTPGAVLRELHPRTSAAPGLDSDAEILYFKLMLL